LDSKYLYIAIILTVGVAIGSLISLNNLLIPTVQNSDKFIHTTAYFLISLSWLLTFKQKYKVLKTSSLIFFSILLYGIIIEVLQKVITNYRQFDFFDILANLVGIIIAFILFFIVSKKKCIK
jgi:VanZ family protein